MNSMEYGEYVSKLETVRDICKGAADKVSLVALRDIIREINYDMLETLIAESEESAEDMTIAELAEASAEIQKVI